jgi:hypothetical protein
VLSQVKKVSALRYLRRRQVRNRYWTGTTSIGKCDCATRCSLSQALLHSFVETGARCLALPADPCGAVDPEGLSVHQVTVVCTAYYLLAPQNDILDRLHIS